MKGHICVSARLLDQDAKSEQLQTHDSLQFDQTAFEFGINRALKGATVKMLTSVIGSLGSEYCEIPDDFLLQAFGQWASRVGFQMSGRSRASNRRRRQAILDNAPVSRSRCQIPQLVRDCFVGVRVIVRTGLLRSIVDELRQGTPAPLSQGRVLFRRLGG